MDYFDKHLLYGAKVGNLSPNTNTVSNSQTVGNFPFIK